MKYFRADLHVHSRFSRATSGRLNIRNLAAWSMINGLSVMSTGDFTHPAWRDELRRDLVYDDNSGLYRVREKTPLETEIPGFSRPDGVSEPQFLIQAEISSIYKKDGSVRKVHNVVIMPSLESADKLSNKLAAIGNITSDGRPILGLDCEHLLEMVLEADERGVLIPAHIWTPWFSLFGSKSGFDALEDCFGSLSSHIFALETGLSSDPDMNRLWSALDRYALVSNSDAHSGENLGREANLFEGTPSYDGIFDALRRAARDEEGSGCIYRGTVEFFPEEGKYHLDGHRACNVVLEPEESMKIGNICPVCGKRTPYGFDCALCATTLPATPAPCLECTRNPDLSEDLSIGLSDRWERRRRTFGDKVTWHREEHILIAQPLTEQEKIEYGQEMADALDQIEKYEAELDGQRKLYKRLIEQQEKIAKDAAKLYREGKEEREIFCDCLKDWNTFEMVWVEAEPPYAEVQRRPMTPEEKQPSLLDYDHKPESTEVAKAAKALEREPAECLEVQ